MTNAIVTWGVTLGGGVLVWMGTENGWLAVYGALVANLVVNVSNSIDDLRDRLT